MTVDCRNVRTSSSRVLRWLHIAWALFSVGGARRGQAQGTTKRLAVNHDQLSTPWLTGLDRLPEEFSPLTARWNNSMALCAVMKDENATDVKEWLQYYQWLGVDHVFLFDNGSADKTIIERLRPHFSPLYVTFAIETTSRAQLKVYAQCMEEYRARYNWLLFFDLDEYLVVRDRTPGGLKGVLEDYKMHGGLSVHWIFVGPGGRKRRAPRGGVLRSYTRCVPAPEARVKTIANSWFVDGTSIHPHNHHYRDNVLAVNEAHERLELTWKLKAGVSKAHPRLTRWDCPSQPQLCTQTPSWRHTPPVAARVALFHYATKSLEDFTAKMRRGSGMSEHTKTLAYLDDIRRRETDAAICKEPAAVAELCCRVSPQH